MKMGQLHVNETSYLFNWKEHIPLQVEMLTSGGWGVTGERVGGGGWGFMNVSCLVQVYFSLL